MSILLKLRGSFIAKSKVVKICFLGLDKAGKSSVLKWLLGKEFDESSDKRTIGMEVAKINLPGIELVAWDIGGQKGFRETIWQTYILGSKAIIYVIDSSDRDRILESKTELEKYVFSNKKFNSIPILLLANKQDSDKSLSINEIKFLLNLRTNSINNFKLFNISCKTGLNLQEAFDWLYKQIINYDGNIPTQIPSIIPSYNF